MAIHASPGVYTQTLDYSSYASTVTSTVLALVGKTRKGPSEPTYISTARQFTDTFGLPRKGEYSALAALSYLEYGSALWFRRMVGKNAIKASAGIPTALAEKVINSSTGNSNVTVDGKYIYTISLTDVKGDKNSVVKPIPGSINVSIVDPTHNISDISFSDSQVNTSRGIFDPEVYQGITSYAHYVDYNTGEYRFTIKDSVLPSPDAGKNKVLVIKYLRKVVDVSEQTLHLATDTDEAGEKVYASTYTYAVDGNYVYTNSGCPSNATPVPALKSSIDAEKFTITIIDVTNTYTIKCKTYGDSGSKATLTCLDPNDGTTELLNQTKDTNGVPKSYIDLTTGVWSLQFTTPNKLNKPAFYVEYTYDVFRYKVITVATPLLEQDITGSVNVPVYTKSFFVYYTDEITSDDPTVVIDYTAFISNRYNALISDDGNGNLIDYGSQEKTIEYTEPTEITSEKVLLSAVGNTHKIFTNTNALAHIPNSDGVDFATSSTSTGKTLSYDASTGKITLTYTGEAPDTDPASINIKYAYDTNKTKLGAVANTILEKGLPFKEYGLTLEYLNSVDYNTGKINFVLATLPTADFNINIECMAKYEKTIGNILKGEGADISKSKIISATLDSAIIPENVTITVSGQKKNIKTGLYEDFSTSYVDDSDGNISIADSSITTDKSYGNIEYRIRNTKTGAMSAELEFKYAGGENTSDTPYKVSVSYIREMGLITAYSYGVAFNSTVVQFYQEDFKNTASNVPTYYGYKLWLPETLTTTTADEYGRSFTFNDVNATTYFLNKINSQYVEFEFYDTEKVLIPVLGVNISLSGGNDDEDNINESTAISALEIFNNTETYDISLVACPDYAGSKAVMLKLLDLCENGRGDCFAIIDPPKGLSVKNVVAWHNGDGIYAAENAFNSNMGALYYPWIQINNEFTEAYEWVPPSVKIVSVYAYSDNNSQVWFAPAGINRGRILNAIKLEKVLTIAERDLLYATDNNCVNPICDFVGDGMVVWGQKTLQRSPTALDRVNVTRLIIYITKMLAKSVRELLFDPDDQITWVCYRQIVEPFLSRIKSNRGLYDYLVKCDSSTNTDSDIDNNTMVAEVWLKPTKTAERIITKFYITATGATLGSITSDNNNQ